MVWIPWTLTTQSHNIYWEHGMTWVCVIYDADFCIFYRIPKTPHMPPRSDWGNFYLAHYNF